MLKRFMPRIMSISITYLHGVPLCRLLHKKSYSTTFFCYGSFYGWLLLIFFWIENLNLILFIGIDISHGFFYCFICSSYLYDSDIKNDILLSKRSSIFVDESVSLKNNSFHPYINRKFKLRCSNGMELYSQNLISNLILFVSIQQGYVVY